MKSDYEVSLEIAGPSAMFARPDSGSTPISYPAPTRGASRAMFESVARIKSAYIQPTHVEVCAPIRYERYVTNYGGPLRKDMENSYQLIAMRLVNVCYRIYGVVRAISASPGEHNHLHALQEIFSRRLKKGQLHYTPFLGWKEFVPSYFGPLRESSGPDGNVSTVIPSMLVESFARPGEALFAPTYAQDVLITDGVLRYAK